MSNLSTVLFTVLCLCDLLHMLRGSWWWYCDVLELFLLNWGRAFVRVEGTLYSNKHQEIPGKQVEKKKIWNGCWPIMISLADWFRELCEPLGGKLSKIKIWQHATNTQQNITAVFITWSMSSFILFRFESQRLTQYKRINPPKMFCF